MISWYNIKLKISDLIYRNVFYRLGYGRPNKQAEWESGYAGGYWDHLESEDEAVRYKAITEMVKTFKTSNSIFDIGCGVGVLYQYFKHSLSSFSYLGIDISANAIKQAKGKYPGTDFRQMDFDKEDLDEKFDIIIFNETLEYFIRPLNKLRDCADKNLLPNGVFIISMYKGHDGLWDSIIPHFKILKEVDIQNQKGQSWKIKIMQPK